MLKRILAGSILIALASQASAGGPEPWVVLPPVVSAWKIVPTDNAKGLYGCQNSWTPKVVSLAESRSTQMQLQMDRPAPGTAFVIIDSTKTISQNQNDCKVDMVRTVQIREQNRETKVYRTITQKVEKMTLVNQLNTYSPRNFNVDVSPWINAGEAYLCNWNPAPETVAAGKSFVQTGTACKVDQHRTRIESVMKGKSVIDGRYIIEKQTLSMQTVSKTAIGKKQIPEIGKKKP